MAELLRDRRHAPSVGVGHLRGKDGGHRCPVDDAAAAATRVDRPVLGIEPRVELPVTKPHARRIVRRLHLWQHVLIRLGCIARRIVVVATVVRPEPDRRVRHVTVLVGTRPLATPPKHAVPPRHHPIAHAFARREDGEAAPPGLDHGSGCLDPRTEGATTRTEVLCLGARELREDSGGHAVRVWLVEHQRAATLMGLGVRGHRACLQLGEHAVIRKTRPRVRGAARAARKAWEERRGGRAIGGHV